MQSITLCINNNKCCMIKSAIPCQGCWLSPCSDCSPGSASHATQIFIPYLPGLLGMYYLKAQWPLKRIRCSSTVTSAPGLYISCRWHARLSQTSWMAAKLSHSWRAGLVSRSSNLSTLEMIWNIFSGIVAQKIALTDWAGHKLVVASLLDMYTPARIKRPRYACRSIQSISLAPLGLSSPALSFQLALAETTQTALHTLLDPGDSSLSPLPTCTFCQWEGWKTCLSHQDSAAEAWSWSCSVLSSTSDTSSSSVGSSWSVSSSTGFQIKSRTCDAVFRLFILL